MKKPLIILAGPTAVGKTKASIGLAKRIGAEIISADSMQVYKHMDIGSAKITRSEMSGISHHLIDILEPEEEFNVVRFQKMALEEMEQIYEKGKIPLIVGGTGFYIHSFVTWAGICEIILILRKMILQMIIGKNWRFSQRKKGQNTCIQC